MFSYYKWKLLCSLGTKGRLFLQSLSNQMMLMSMSVSISILLSFFYFLNPISVVDGNCDSEIYCRGPILEKIQMSGLFTDSKQFVDMPTSKSKAVVLYMHHNHKTKPDIISLCRYRETLQHCQKMRQIHNSVSF